jgi:hypothetical protein
VGLCLSELMWFDLVEKTFASDAVLVPYVVGFVSTFASAVLVVVRVQEGLNNL